MILLTKPETQTAAAASSWQYPVTRETLALWDLADIIVAALGGKNTKSVHTRPWDKPKKKTASKKLDMNKLMAEIDAGKFTLVESSSQDVA